MRPLSIALLWIGATGCIPGLMQIAPAAAPSSSSQPAAPADGSAADSPDESSAETGGPAAPAEPALPPEVDLAPPAGMPDLRPIIGKRADGGRAPLLFAELRREMGPAEVAALFPGADKLVGDFSPKLKVKGVAGVDHVRFFFFRGVNGDEPPHLSSATIAFSEKYNDSQAFFEYLVKAVSNKLGPRPQEEIDKKLLTWVDQDLRSMQLLKISSWQITYSPPNP